MNELVEKVKGMSPWLAFVVYGGVAVTLFLLWLVLPQYSVRYVCMSGWDGTFYLNWDSSFVAFLFVQNALLPGIALLLTFLNKRCNILFALITSGYALTTGLVFMCVPDFGVTVLWFLIMGIYAAWSLFAIFRRGLPAYL